MAEIDVKFMKGNKQTLKEMSKVYKPIPKKGTKTNTTKKSK